MKFIIFKGMHYAFPLYIWPHFNVKEAHFKVHLSEAHWYPREAVGKTGINKLPGLGYGFDHHKHSVRLGWQPDFNDKGCKKIKLHAYWYDSYEDDYQEQYLCSVDAGTDFWYTIYVRSKEYVMEVEGVKFNIKKDHNIAWGFWMRPYFGGESKAPRTLVSKIRRRVFKN